MIKVYIRVGSFSADSESRETPARSVNADRYKAFYMKQIVSFLAIIIFLFSCSDKNVDNEKIRAKMFIDAYYDYNTSAPSYLVIIAVNENTKEEKVIFCDAETLNYSLTLENKKIIHPRIIVASDYKISFKNEKALKEIGFYRFNSELLDSVRQVIDNSIIEAIKLGHQQDNDSVFRKYQFLYPEYLEIILFENGVEMFRDCESGWTVISNIN